MELDLSSLNESQQTAVCWNQGPLLVLAGPGSGKTRVLTTRIARIILESPAQSFRVLALTFTAKAAAEMRSRVDLMVSDGRERALLTTFHSFCADILRQHGNHIGLSPDFIILNQEADREAVLEDAVRQVEKSGIDTERSDIKLLPLIDRLREECYSESEVAARFRNDVDGTKLVALYREYRQQLIDKNSLDYASLLQLTHKLLTGKPVIARHLRSVYRHICVDEFQDTNLAQYKVLEAVVGEDVANLFVVADDDQIIYQWNGASPERLRKLRAQYDMAVVQLPTNYRCPPEVIVLANSLIANNVDRSPDKVPLEAVKPIGDYSAVRLLEFPTDDDELAGIANDIAQRSHDEWGNCVVLARTRKTLERAVEFIASAGLEASLVLKKNEFESAPMRWLHSMLRLANARSDREQLRRICKSFYELEGVLLDVQEVIALSSQLGGDFLRSWFRLVLLRNELDVFTRDFLIRASQQIAERMEFLSFIDGSNAWFEALRASLMGPNAEGFVDYVEEKDIWEGLQNDVLRKYGRSETSLTVFLQEFDLTPKSVPIPANAVRCLTIHGAKGLEFGHVYLVGLAEDVLPSFQSKRKGDQSREMQEERRNCFVAITRTESSLTLSYAARYFGWPKQPSRFLYEMGLLSAK